MQPARRARLGTAPGRGGKASLVLGSDHWRHDIDALQTKKGQAMQPLSVAVLLIAGLTTSISRPVKECLVLTGPYIMKSPEIELVFSGRVVEYEVTADAAYRATFDVDRVWKGTVRKRIEIHVWQLQGEMPRYGKDGEYIVLAKQLTDPRVREAVGLGATDRPAFTPTTCADALSTNIRKELGPGSPPKQ